MDLGIAGRRALVCAASKGLGRGCAQALADAGCEVTIVARNGDLLRKTAEEIGARAGRPVGFVAGLARKVAAHNGTINNLRPGSFDTDRMRATIDARAKAQGRAFEDALGAVRMATPARRFGTIDEFGATCAFLCSTHAGYIVGQNILIDGGNYPGTF